MIAIIDYGLGNVMAFLNVFKRQNVSATVAKSAAVVRQASKLIMPGVGSFDQAMRQLDDSGMRPAIEECVLQKRVPILGICVGMQMLANSSEEGQLPGLGWIPGTVKKFDLKHMPPGTNLPHMGWNDVTPNSPRSLFAAMECDARFYFLHSYYFEAQDQRDVLATTNCGIQFSCAVQRDNIHGVQFHPEKSHHFGSQLLTNFAKG